MNHAFEFHLNQLLDEYRYPENFCPIFALEDVVQNFSGKLYDEYHRRLERAINLLPRQSALADRVDAHTLSHRLMMDLYANWQLRYRTAPAILSFLEAIEPERYTGHLTNEYFDASPLRRGVIGFLIVHKCC